MALNSLLKTDSREGVYLLLHEAYNGHVQLQSHETQRDISEKPVFCRNLMSKWS